MEINLSKTNNINLLSEEEIKKMLTYIENRLSELNNILALHQKAKISYVDAIKKEIIGKRAGIILE